MLVLTRRVGERIHIGNDIEVVLVSLQGNRVRIGIEAPKEVPVVRNEISQQPTEKTLDPAG